MSINFEIVALQDTDVARKIASRFKKVLFIQKFNRFADGEVEVVLDDYKRYAGKTVVIVQSTGNPVNEYTLGVAFLAHALKQAGSTRVIAVVPYLGYSRQDKGITPTSSGSVAVIAKLFEQAGIDELITVELHNVDSARYFTIPVMNVSVRDTIAAHIKRQLIKRDRVCLIAPDKGVHDYVKAIAEQLRIGTVMFFKERFSPDQTRITACATECQGTIGIIIDDIVSTGGTAINAARKLLSMGYMKIFGYFVHPVLVSGAFEILQKGGFDFLCVSNTLPLPADVQQHSFVTVLDVSESISSVLQERLMDKS